MGISACLTAGIGNIPTRLAHSHIHAVALQRELRGRLQGFTAQLYFCFLSFREWGLKLNSFKIYLKEKILINYSLIELKMFNLP